LAAGKPPAGKSKMRSKKQASNSSMRMGAALACGYAGAHGQSNKNSHLNESANYDFCETKPKLNSRSKGFLLPASFNAREKLARLPHQFSKLTTLRNSFMRIESALNLCRGSEYHNIGLSLRKKSTLHGVVFQKK
jgi:hypothetical protein